MTGEDIELLATQQNFLVERVYRADLVDPRTQNMVLLSYAVSGGHLPGLEAQHVKAALQDLLPEKLPEKLYEKNVGYFE